MMMVMSVEVPRRPASSSARNSMSGHCGRLSGMLGQPHSMRRKPGRSVLTSCSSTGFFRRPSPPLNRHDHHHAGGRIFDISPTPQGNWSMELPAGSSIVNLAGKFVTPGIIKRHGHVGRRLAIAASAIRALTALTTTTSMYFDQDDVQEFKKQQKAGDLRGARILTVMYRFMSEPFKPGSENKTPEGGPRQGRRDRRKDTVS